MLILSAPGDFDVCLMKRNAHVFVNGRGPNGFAEAVWEG